MANVGLYLKRDTTHKHAALPPNVVTLEGDSDPVTVHIDRKITNIVVNFASSADGRGFSLVRHLRNRLHFQGELVAVGSLIPDQVGAAFSCGFDAVWVPEEKQLQYGLQHWLDAAAGQDAIHYWAGGRAGIRQAWSERAR